MRRGPAGVASVWGIMPLPVALAGWGKLLVLTVTVAGVTQTRAPGAEPRPESHAALHTGRWDPGRRLPGAMPPPHGTVHSGWA